MFKPTLALGMTLIFTLSLFVSSCGSNGVDPVPFDKATSFHSIDDLFTDSDGDGFSDQTELENPVKMDPANNKKPEDKEKGNCDAGCQVKKHWAQFAWGAISMIGAYAAVKGSIWLGKTVGFQSPVFNKKKRNSAKIPLNSVENLSINFGAYESGFSRIMISKGIPPKMVVDTRITVSEGVTAKNDATGKQVNYGQTARLCISYKIAPKDEPTGNSSENITTLQLQHVKDENKWFKTYMISEDQLPQLCLASKAVGDLSGNHIAVFLQHKNTPTNYDAFLIGPEMVGFKKTLEENIQVGEALVGLTNTHLNANSSESVFTFIDSMENASTGYKLQNQFDDFPNYACNNDNLKCQVHTLLGMNTNSPDVLIYDAK